MGNASAKGDRSSGGGSGASLDGDAERRPINASAATIRSDELASAACRSTLSSLGSTFRAKESATFGLELASLVDVQSRARSLSCGSDSDGTSCDDGHGQRYLGVADDAAIPRRTVCESSDRTAGDDTRSSPHNPTEPTLSKLQTAAPAAALNVIGVVRDGGIPARSPSLCETGAAGGRAVESRQPHALQHDCDKTPPPSLISLPDNCARPCEADVAAVTSEEITRWRRSPRPPGCAARPSGLARVAQTQVAPFLQRAITSSQRSKRGDGGGGQQQQQQQHCAATSGDDGRREAVKLLRCPPSSRYVVESDRRP